MLEATSIHAAICQRVTSTVPQHVNMYSERQSRCLTGSFDYACDAHSSERVPTFVHEYIRARLSCIVLLPFQTLQAAELVTFQVIAAVD